MRWKAKVPTKMGTLKTFKRFAILPMEMTDGTTVWLEYYFADKKYYSGFYGSYWATLWRYTKE